MKRIQAFLTPSNDYLRHKYNYAWNALEYLVLALLKSLKILQTYLRYVFIHFAKNT